MLKTISWQCQLVKLVKLERPFVSSAWSLRKHGTRSLLLLGLTDRHNILHICGQLPTAKNDQLAMSTGQTGQTGQTGAAFRFFGMESAKARNALATTLPFTWA